MVNSFRIFLVGVVLGPLLLSCSDEVATIKKKEYRPVRIEETAYKRELIYNESGQLTRVVSESEMPDKEKITTVQDFDYDASGKIISSKIDGERLYRYTWEENRIVKTEELENGVPTHRFVFSYQSNGMIKEMLTYKYEGSEVVALKGKIVYAFDPNKNISSVTEFSFQENVYSLVSIYEYDRYDNFPSADSNFDYHTLNTGLQLQKNNPGRMISKNKNGVAFSIEDYVYEYNEEGYPVKRQSTITFLHIGSTGSYDTHYFFEEI